MPKLNRLKARFSQIKNIEKITKVMEMIANAKIPKIKKQFSQAEQFFVNLDSIFQLVINSIENLDLFASKQENKQLFILFTSNLGFCGSFNNLIIKTFQTHYKPGDDIIIFGKRGVVALQKFSQNFLKVYENIEENNFEETLNEFSELIISHILNKTYSKINVCYNKFINIITSVPSMHQIFPFKKVEKEISNNFIDFEPSSEEILNRLIPFYTKATIHKLFLESKLVEIASRRVAMENASDNATEIIEKLDLQINSSRQTIITQEIIEIIGANLEH